MTAVSGGLLVYRWVGTDVEVLIAHPGGPFWSRKDEGAWSIPKGEIDPAESPRDAALREFAEETGFEPPSGPLRDLGSVTLKSGKVVSAWAAEGDYDPEALRPGTFEMEWPPRSGRTSRFPEIDRVAWCSPAEARVKLNPAQVELVERLLTALGGA